MDVTSLERDKSPGLFATVKATIQDGIGRYRALKDAPESRKLLIAAAGTRIGYRASTVALVALSFKLGDGALGVGGMLAILMGPGLFVQPFAGSVVDRFPGKNMLVLTSVLMALLASSYMLLSAFPSIWLLYAITLVTGIVQTFDMPATEIRLMLLTPRELRGTANAVQMLSITAGEIIGPIVGGLLLATMGGNAVFVLSAIMLLVFARVVARLPERVEGSITDPKEGDTAQESATSRSGYLALWRHSNVRLYVGVVAATYALLYGTVTLYIVRAGELGLGDGSVGLFYTVMGIGTFFGSIIGGMGAYTTRRALGIAGIASVLGAIAVIAFGVAGTIFLALPALVIVGIIGDIEEIAAMTYFQNHLPERFYGRFFSMFMMAGSIGGLVGSLGGPLLAERYSTGAAVITFAVPLMVISSAFAIREGGVRLSFPPFAAQPEPEVVGHGLFRPQRTPQELREMRVDGRPVLLPISARLA